MGVSRSKDKRLPSRGSRKGCGMVVMTPVAGWNEHVGEPFVVVLDCMTARSCYVQNSMLVRCGIILNENVT